MVQLPQLLFLPGGARATFAFFCFESGCKDPLFSQDTFQKNFKGTIFALLSKIMN